MSTTLPRIVVAAPGSGHGKTTVATGLMAALSARGLTVSGHKVGPDYIDPGYHALATGRPGRNLDPFLAGADRIVPLLLHGAAGADVAVIEGVMGLFDGRLGAAGEASTAHVAALTSSPVIVVVDISHASRTHAAVVAGLAAFDPAARIAGVILNKARTTRHSDEVREALARTGIPVLGVLGRDAGVETPSRHLGLVPAAERAESAATLASLTRLIDEHVDLDAVLEIARDAAPLAGAPWNPADEVRAPSGARPVVAMAGGRAFTFRYAETEELLRAAGCDVVEFDPLTDPALPAGTSAVYLGGGFPEVHVGELACNTALIGELRAAIDDGVPTVAECAGLTYLCRTLDDVPVIGAVNAAAAMTPRLTLGYRTATAPADSVLTAAGEQVTGHEFHRTATTLDPDAAGDAAWTLPGGADGVAGPTLHAAYLHVHWAGHPHLAQRFADAAHAYAGSAPPPRLGTSQGVRHDVVSDAPVAPPCPETAAEAAARLAALATPPGALGRLGRAAVWLAAVQRRVPPREPAHPRLVIFAGDHGVAGHGVSAFPSSITAATVRAALNGQLATNALAAAHGVTVRVLDLGVDDDFADLPAAVRTALQRHKVRRSSGAIHLEDALTDDEVRAALAAGEAVARHEIATSADLLLSGDLGIGNTTPAAALVAAALGLSAADVVGRGSGLDDAGLRHKTTVVDTALSRIGDRAADPVATLAALGSADLAASTGYLLTAARRGVPVLLDGLMAVACALTAERIAPGAAAWFTAGHRSTEPAQSLALDKLGLTPLLDLELRLGEGSGAVAAVPVLRSAAAVLGHTALLTDLMPG
ncbi:cobyrinate a,c-diamide synthase [Mycobacterium sp. PS03-16]|uniref:cobyrinate a,c-diamide synthase n=1 Tax=Mycobacterium sp. PS03-16 TaxID=2559611 RepID=UPI001FD75E09|nr:cobyrinate a,c-diamide synthase [Mycobacterium sp. PS03-16]